MPDRVPGGDPGPASDRLNHRFAVALACATVVLLAAGGLVTSTGSGLAVPDWPLSFGRFFPPMVGGVLYEHGHRLIAAFVGLLTLAVATLFLARERRRWVRRLALAAVGVVVAQGILGGVTVLLRLPTSVSVAHACLAQAFFCLTVLLALATSPRLTARDHEPSVEPAPPLWAIGGSATALVYGQLILGAILRHTGAGLAIPDVPLAFGRIIPPLLSFEIGVHFAHRVGALVVAALVAWVASRVLRFHRTRGDLVRPSLLALALVVLQILLGAAAVRTRLAVLPATAHVVTGALLLAACLVLTVRAGRARPSWPRALAAPAAAGEAA